MKDLGKEACETLLLYKTQPINLLLVEDNREDADLASHEITHCAPNCVIKHAWSGQEAIDQVKTIAQNLQSENASAADARQFDVALIDLVLPGGSDGLDTAVRITGFAPLIVIFICSGAIVSDRAMQQAIQRGFAILPKPLRRQHVEMILNAVRTAKDRERAAYLDPMI